MKWWQILFHNTSVLSSAKVTEFIAHKSACENKEVFVDLRHDIGVSTKGVEYQWEFCNDRRCMLHVGQNYGTENRDSTLLNMHIFR